MMNPTTLCLMALACVASGQLCPPDCEELPTFPTLPPVTTTTTASPPTTPGITTAPVTTTTHVTEVPTTDYNPSTTEDVASTTVMTTTTSGSTESETTTVSTTESTTSVMPSTTTSSTSTGVPSTTTEGHVETTTPAPETGNGIGAGFIAAISTVSTLSVACAVACYMFRSLLISRARRLRHQAQFCLANNCRRGSIHSRPSDISLEIYPGSQEVIHRVSNFSIDENVIYERQPPQNSFIDLDGYQV